MGPNTQAQCCGNGDVRGPSRAGRFKTILYLKLANRFLEVIVVR